MQNRRTFLGIAAASLLPVGIDAQTPAPRPAAELARHALTGPLEAFEIVLVELNIPPGARSSGPGHRHPGPVLGYIVEGQMRFAINNEPEQVLVVETSAGVHEQEMQKAVQAWVLPLHDPQDPDEAKQKRAHAWSDSALIGPEVLRRATPLKLEAIASEKEYTTRHAFKLRADVGRWIYVQVKKGLRGFGGYVLGETYVDTARVLPYPRQLRILHSGSILSTSGEKKGA